MAAVERHYTVVEVARLWGLSPDTIRNIFRDREGVLKLGKHETLHKRSYLSLRIPDSVLQQVHAELRARR